MSLYVGDKEASALYFPTYPYPDTQRQISSLIYAGEQLIFPKERFSEYLQLDADPETVELVNGKQVTPYRMEPPTWATHVEVHLLGAGGGGNGGGGLGVDGRGGAAGRWNAGTLKVIPGKELFVLVGLGGRGGESASGRGTSGAPTTAGTIMALDGHYLVADGGAAGGSDSSNGESATSKTVGTVVLQGGAGGQRERPGISPGGGGGGGAGSWVVGTSTPGRDGGHGLAYIRFARYGVQN